MDGRRLSHAEAEGLSGNEAFPACLTFQPYFGGTLKGSASEWGYKGFSWIVEIDSELTCNFLNGHWSTDIQKKLVFVKQQ